MTSRKENLWPFIFIVIPLCILYVCYKYCCKRNENVILSVPPEPYSPILPSRRWGSSSPPRTPLSQIGFAEDVNSNGYRAPYLPVSTNTIITRYPPYTTPYPLANTMPQPLDGNTHFVSIYPLRNTSSEPAVPESDDLPPSYLEATRN